MRIYIATKYEEKSRAAEMAEVLERAGHTITYKWWFNEQVTIEQALADMWGVVGADALVLIVEKDLNYCGALVEMGIAIGCDKPVYVLGHQLDDRCIFMHLPSVHKGIEPLL